MHACYAATLNTVDLPITKVRRGMKEKKIRPSSAVLEYRIVYGCFPLPGHPSGLHTVAFQNASALTLPPMFVSSCIFEDS
jgi:hypothetical protein